MRGRNDDFVDAPLFIYDFTEYYPPNNGQQLSPKVLAKPIKNHPNLDMIQTLMQNRYKISQAVHISKIQSLAKFNYLWLRFSNTHDLLTSQQGLLPRDSHHSILDHYRLHDSLHYNSMHPFHKSSEILLIQTFSRSSKVTSHNPASCLKKSQNDTV